METPPAAGSDDGLAIQLLGGFRVRVGERTIPDAAWSLRKGAALVKLLALAPGHRLPREQAEAWLWPELAPAAAANNLHRTLYAVRRVLHPPDGRPSCLHLAGDGLRLHAGGPTRIDVDAYEAAAAAARRTDDPAAGWAAVALYGGDLLPDDPYGEWALRRREALRQSHVALLLGLAERHQKTGELDRAIEALGRALASEPAHEAAHRGLMRCYALAGQTDQALRQYQQLREALAGELDAAPDAASQRLYRSIVVGRLTRREPAPTAGRRAAATATEPIVTPSGATEPTAAPLQTAAPMAAPVMATIVPPPRSATNLPAALTSFVGREREVGEVRRLLGETRLLTLTGAGGVGKTRLALALAGAAAGDYPDGVWLVELAPFADPALVARAVAGVVGVAEQPGQPIIAALATALRDRRLLLVVDNCEHLLDATSALIEALLRACPDLRVLATSRELLGVAGEVAWRVPSLPAPDEAVPPGEMPAFPAVCLFAERARLVQPAFAVTEANAGAVAQVCRRLDGLPLALELAAARVVALSVEQVAARLDDRFRLLTGGRRTAVRRQQTLAATLDWSHDLLSEPERALLRRLSVFAGGFALEAAEAVGAGDGVEGWEVVDLLTRLVEKSLVQAESGPGGATRYRLLETIREYAGEKLDKAGETTTVGDRRLAWAVGLAEAAEPALLGREQIAWLDRLEAEHDNIRAALRWAGERGDAELALRLTGNLWHFWDVRGYYVEARANYDAALALPGAEAPTAARALALVGAGYMTLYAADIPAAERRLEEAVALAERVGEPRIAVLAMGGLVGITAMQGDYATGQQQAHVALDRAREIGDAWAESMVMRRLAKNALWHGDHAALRYWIDQRLPQARRIGQPWLEHNLHCDLAELARFDGDRAAMRTHTEDALALSRALATPNSIAGCLLILAAIALDDGDVIAARRHGVEGLRMLRDLGNRGDLPHGIEAVAGLAAATGRPARALRLAGAAAASRAALGAQPTAREREGIERWLAPARQALTDAEQAAAWAGGAALTLDDAVAEALALAAPTG